MDSIEDKITYLQSKLNGTEYVKPEYFIPSHMEFRRLVCVNHITALYLSNNCQPIPSLIKIARMELCEQPEIDGFKEFSALALEYLEVMEGFVNDRHA